MKRQWIAAGLLALAATGVGVAGCKEGGPSGPQSGTLTVNLSTPNSDDGALRFDVSGPAAPGSPTAGAAGYKIYTRTAGNTLKVAVVGNIAAGAVLRFGVSDVSQTYTATLIQAASRSNALRAASGYTLTITGP